MPRAALYSLNLYLIAAVWAINGLVKVLHLVPRHQQIVARILGPTWAGPLTVLLGLGELLLAGWVLGRRWPGPTVAAQVGLVLTMNLLEAALAPDLLLWGRLNLLFALLFCAFLVGNWQLGHPKPAPPDAVLPADPPLPG